MRPCQKVFVQHKSHIVSGAEEPALGWLWDCEAHLALKTKVYLTISLRPKQQVGCWLRMALGKAQQQGAYEVALVVLVLCFCLCFCLFVLMLLGAVCCFEHLITG